MNVCRLTLKGGEEIDVNFSATRVKHMKRTGGVIVLQGAGGKKILLPAVHIVNIESLAPVEAEAYSAVNDGNLFTRPSRLRRGFRLILSFLSLLHHVIDRCFPGSGSRAYRHAER